MFHWNMRHFFAKYNVSVHFTGNFNAAFWLWTETFLIFYRKFIDISEEYYINFQLFLLNVTRFVLNIAEQTHSYQLKFSDLNGV